jgi:hypothetical protein
MWYEVRTPSEEFNGRRYGVSFRDGVAHVSDDMELTRSTTKDLAKGITFKVADLMRDELGYAVTPLEPGETPLPLPVQPL